MPRLSETKQKARIRKIENAALWLFKRRGYHGVGLRDVAKRAKVSLGNIYNYFEGKEPIFEALVDRLYADFASQSEPLAEAIRAGAFPDDLPSLGAAIGQMVERHADYLTLVYVDIAEFDGKHVRPHYEGLAKRFGWLMADQFEQLSLDVDPAVAFTLVYMQFSNYFIVRRLIGADHLGLPEDQAIEVIAKLFSGALTKKKSRRKKKNG